MSYLYVHIRIGQLKNVDNTKFWKICKLTQYSYIVGKDIKWYGHSESKLAVSKKSKSEIVTLLSNCTPRHLSRRNENICLCKILYMNVDRGFVCNSHNWKQPDVLQWENG